MRFLRRYLLAAFMPGEVVENMNRQVDVSGVPRRAGRALARARHSVLHNKWAGASLALWIAGLLIAFVLPAPVGITPEKYAAYSRKARRAETYNNVLHRAQSEVHQYETAYRHEQGWFPWFASAERKERTASARAQYREVQRDFQRIEDKHALAEREANRELGLFSRMGVSMAKANFWDAFERGKVIGRRNTFIDGVFSIIMNRENELIDIVVKLAFYLILNMGTAMFVMFWLFLFSLPKFIWSFGATWWEGLLFFALAATAAASVMVTFMGLLAGAAGGVTYGVLRAAGRRRRIAPASDGRRRLQGQRVPGYAHVNLNGEAYYRPVRQSQEGSAAGIRQRAQSTAQ